MDSAHAILIASIVSAALGAAVFTWRAGRPLTRLAVLASIGLYLIHQLGLLRLHAGQSSAEADAALRIMFVSAVLAGPPWSLLAALTASAQPVRKLRGQMAFVAAASILALALLAATGTDVIVREVRQRPDGTIVIGLGMAGKLMMVYLIGVATFVLAQVETLLRSALRLTDRNPKLVLACVGLAVVSYVYVGAEAILYGRVSTGQLTSVSAVTAAAFLIGTVAAFRGSLGDRRLVPGRDVVHSSLTLFILGALMIILGLFSRVAEWVGIDLDRTLMVALAAVVGGLLTLLWFSPRFKRRVASFVEANFYVNRYDYCAEWSRLVRLVRPTADRTELVRSICDAAVAAFGARGAWVAVLSPAANRYLVYDRSGTLVPDFDPPRASSLASLLRQRAESITLTDLEGDLELIPGYVENQTALERLGVVCLSPMMSGDELLGFLMLAAPERGGRYSPEDLNLLTVVGAEVANSVYGHLLLREVEERREGEALVRLSSFVLHDLKNSVSAVRGLVDSAERYIDREDFRRDLIESLAMLGSRMSRLMEKLSRLHTSRRLPGGSETTCDLAGIVKDAVRSARAERAPGVRVALDVSEGVQLRGDREMLEQVFFNLIRNSLDAMPQGGALALEGRVDTDANEARISVSDTGCGISARFLSESLFRPFATTKDGGLGIGLYQCKNIVEDHGGRIRIDSTPGAGTRVEIRLPLQRTESRECETVS